jgi:hypothetical protein
MRIKPPPHGHVHGHGVSGTSRKARRTGLDKVVSAEKREHESDGEDGDSPFFALTSKVRQLNRKPPGDWDTDDYRELERLAEMLLAHAERIAGRDPNNPHLRQQSVEQAKMQLRMLLQTLQPPPELLESFTNLWAKARGLPNFEISTFARKTLMNDRVRRDVMNLKMEESVDQADRLATEQRVQAIDPDPEEQSEGEQPGADDEGDLRGKTLKVALRQLKKKRRTIGAHEVNEVAQKALDLLRMLRESVAPSWAPETQPWLLQTADTHVFQSVLAVIPEQLFRETTAYEGMQKLRAGEHTFGTRAAARLEEGLARRKP